MEEINKKGAHASTTGYNTTSILVTQYDGI